MAPIPPHARHADVLRLYRFHLRQVVSPLTEDLDVGIPARGLHGEEYHGRVFWDEAPAITWLSQAFPSTARSALDYRHRRLDTARQEAHRLRCSGARYPWQSGSKGTETTVPWVKNPLSGRWQSDHTALQQHVGASIAHSVARYAHHSGDITYLHTKGAAMICEIAQFYSTRSTEDVRTGRYHLKSVVGPDAFHDMLPNSSTPGVDDNAYTNIAAASTLHLAAGLWHSLSDRRRGALTEATGLDASDVGAWEHISRRMFVPFHNGVISQFAGYHLLTHVTLENLADRYGNDLGRLDRLMEKDGDHPRNYQIAKQADVLMLPSTLSSERRASTLSRLGYDASSDLWQRTVNYYLKRTVHGSTLSNIAHATALREIGHPQAQHYLDLAFQTDLRDGQRTGYGIHLGAMSAVLGLAYEIAHDSNRCSTPTAQTSHKSVSDGPV
ncbi:hypothetical protein ACN2WE_00325 [Streptomyces sp. cg28]|uniref:hypothetical protein n=1 Tax=Streptomyces sp. cg28 TaxID=3403457 RepID=UPI003B21CE62